jgi:hypothetical protein
LASLDIQLRPHVLGTGSKDINNTICKLEEGIFPNSITWLSITSTPDQYPLFLPHNLLELQIRIEKHSVVQEGDNVLKMLSNLNSPLCHLNKLYFDGRPRPSTRDNNYLAPIIPQMIETFRFHGEWGSTQFLDTVFTRLQNLLELYEDPDTADFYDFIEFPRSSIPAKLNTAELTSFHLLPTTVIPSTLTNLTTSSIHPYDY